MGFLIFLIVLILGGAIGWWHCLSGYSGGLFERINKAYEDTEKSIRKSIRREFHLLGKK